MLHSLSLFVALSSFVSFQVPLLRVGTESQFFSVFTATDIPVWWQWSDDCQCFRWIGPPYDQIPEQPIFPTGCTRPAWQQREWINGVESVTEHWYLSCTVPMRMGIRAGADPVVPGQEMQYDGYCRVPTDYTGTQCIGSIPVPGGIAINSPQTLDLMVQVRVLAH